MCTTGPCRRQITGASSSVEFNKGVVFIAQPGGASKAVPTKGVSGGRERDIFVRLKVLKKIKHKSIVR